MVFDHGRAELPHYRVSWAAACRLLLARADIVEGNQSGGVAAKWLKHNQRFFLVVWSYG